MADFALGPGLLLLLLMALNGALWLLLLRDDPLADPPGAHPAPPATTSLTGAEGLFAALGLVLLGMGLWGVALAEVGIFGLETLNAGLGMAALSGGVVLARRVRRTNAQAADRLGASLWRLPTPARDWIVIALLTLGAGALFMRPHETILGGADAGVYLNVGVNLAETGALLIHEPALAQLDPQLLPALLRRLPAWDQVEYLRLAGFYRADDAVDLVIPQFFTLHPLWIGVGYALGGLRTGLLVTPMWGVLGVLALYFFSRRLLAAGAWVPAFLLLMTPLQLYFARYSTAEPLSQYLVWLGLWAFTEFGLAPRDRRLWGLLAGLALGSVFLTRIDLLFVLLLPMGRGVELLFSGRRPRHEAWFWLPFLLVTVFAAGHALFFSTPYTWQTFGAIIDIFADQLVVVLIGGVIGGALLLYLVRTQRTRVLAWGRRVSTGKSLRYGVAAAVIVLAFYGYIVRPVLGETRVIPYWFSAGEIAVSNHLNFVRLGWYLSPLGLVLAVMGGVLMLLQARWRLLWPVWAVGGSFSLFYLYKIINNPFHIYMMRRYVPVTLPFFMVGAAYALVWLWRWDNPRATGPAGARANWHIGAKAISAVCFLVLTGWLLYNSRLIWQQVDDAGATGQMAALAAHFEDDAILLFVDELPVGIGDVLGTPLQFQHNLTVFDLQEDAVVRPRLDVQIARWQADGHAVYVVYKLGQTPLFSASELTYVGPFVWETSRLEQSYDHYPSTMSSLQFQLELFRVNE